MKIFPIFSTILRYIRYGPVTHRYPFVPAKTTPVTRGHLVFSIDDCIFCGLCRMHCPSQAIEVSKPDLSWQVDRFRCIICGACIEYCPKDCLAIVPEYLPPAAGQVVDRFKGTPQTDDLVKVR